MSSRNNYIEEHIYDYILNTSLRDTPLHEQLRSETAEMPMGGMQISPDQGQFMALIVKLIGARRILEIGTFTGYSSLVMAQALPEDGAIVACDVSAEYTDVARRYWDEAGVANKINLRIGPGAETLSQLLAEGAAATFDIAFIDADKPELRNLLRELSRARAQRRTHHDRQRTVGRPPRRPGRAGRKRRRSPFVA